jgi:hypothetical protein
MRCFLERAGLRWKYHVVVWQSFAWRQIDSGFAVVDCFGDLVTVSRP